MQEFAGEMPTKETEEAQKELEQGNLDEELQQIADQLQAQKTGQAMQGQRQAQEKMSRFSEQMQQAKKALQQNQQRQIVNEMRRVLQDLLEVSGREEDLKKETQALDQNSARFRNQAQGQMETLRDLTTVLDRLNGLANKTFSVSPEMGKSLGEAMRQMGDAMRSLDQRNGTTASAQQSAAMAALNEAAMQVQKAVNGMMQSGGEGGMGMSGFLQRLRGMTSKQQQINQETQGLTPEQAGAAARLAAEQGAVRKSLEQLAREASNSGQLKKMLGDLQKTAEDMREVQTDLAQGEVNPETIRRQERILSRLLDSQRSTRERDFEEKRRSQTGTDVVRQSPGSLDLSTQEGKNRLRRDLLRALEEGYSREYEDLIRKYFESLNR
jgi:tetratricopeptide (TPR) repeat protein